jgi:hypothetical protein
MHDPAAPPPDQMPAFKPNHIPAGERVWHGLLSVLLTGYGAYGLWVDDLYLPGKRGPGIHLHGLAAWVMALAMLCAVASLLSVVVDHYDRRNNETGYKAFARLTAIAGWVLFALGLILGISKGR